MYEIVADEKDFLVAHKPPDIAVQGSEGSPGFLHLLRVHTGLPSLQMVHRLDKVTSGLFLVAKNSAAARTLTSLFRKHEIRKWYLAISDGIPRKKQGVIRGNMIRSRRGTWKLTRKQSNPAITRFVSRSLLPGLRLFLLIPQTGKTHQVRVALKALGSPVLGDPLYWNPKRFTEKPDRTYLHAYGLAFSFSGKNYSFRCLPRQGRLFLSESFQHTLSALERSAEIFKDP